MAMQHLKKRVTRYEIFIKLFWLSCLAPLPFGFIALKTLNYLAFQSFDFERT